MIKPTIYKDFGEVSNTIDSIIHTIKGRILTAASEAQTRFDVIDRIIREVLQWQHGQITVEEHPEGEFADRIDYKLTSGDYKIIIEAKKIGATFPLNSKQKKLKLTGSILGSGEVNDALLQAEDYAIKEKANVVVVTNGRCWCFYSMDNIANRDAVYANVLSPLDDIRDTETLFNYLCCANVEKNSLLEIGNDASIIKSNILLNEVAGADSRIDRNSLADHIAPAIDNAINGEALLNDPEKLNFCFVSTDTRTKFDKTLKIHISDSKPQLILPAKRIKKSKSPSDLENLVNNSHQSSSSPVTLVIGAVGSGKSTYLKHFELIEGTSILSDKKCHWIYIDFEKMGIGGNPRQFIYNSLKEYLLENHSHNPIDYDTIIKPVYNIEVEKLLRGPYGNLKGDNIKTEEKLNELIDLDFKAVEPYVEKLLTYISNKQLCIIVLDNIDLYEDESLEVSVFSEGIALSKKIKSNIIVSIRDTTYVKHRNEATFNAYELKKLWLDPPPFKEVLSKRLLLARQILKGKQANVILHNNTTLVIPDLSIFFDIVQSSLLNEINGKFIESLSDGNIRRGLILINNFLSSGHVRADLAIKNYLSQNDFFSFPLHEVFKGAVLGHWKFYREDRAEVINLFDAKLNSKTLQLIRVYLIHFLLIRAKEYDKVNTPVKLIIDTFSKIGISENLLIQTLQLLLRNNLVKSSSSENISQTSSISISQSGSYYLGTMANRFEYLESIMFDTSINDDEVWDKLCFYTGVIENYPNVNERIQNRVKRMNVFLGYLEQVENKIFENNEGLTYLKRVEQIKKAIGYQSSFLLSRSGIPLNPTSSIPTQKRY
jgi:hypothetical protein